MDPDIIKQFPSNIFPGVIYVCDLKNTENFYMNSKFEEILGYSHDEITEMGAGIISTLIHPDDKVRVEQVMQNLGKVELGQTIKTEYRLKDKSQKWVWFADTSTVSEVDEAGNVCQIIGTAMDITESKEAHLHVDKVYQMFQFVMDNIPMSICWKDLDGAYLGYNKNFLKKAGLDGDADITGKTDKDLPWKDTNAEAYREAEERVINSNKAELAVLEQHSRSDGQPLIVKADRIPVHDNDGDVVGVLCTHEDVTDNVVLPQTVEALEKRYQLLLQTASDAVFIIAGESGEILEINKQAEILTGYDREELLGNLHSKIHPSDVKGVYVNWFAEQVRKGENSRAEHDISRKQGGKITAEVQTRVFEVDGQRLLRCNYRDVSDLRSVEQSLRELCNGYQMIIEESPQFILQVNSEFLVVQANASFRKFIGEERQNEVEKNFLSLVSEDERDAFKEKTEGLVNVGQRLSFETNFIDCSGNEVKYSCDMQAVCISPELPPEYQIVSTKIDDPETADLLEGRISELDKLHKDEQADLQKEQAEIRKSHTAEKEQSKKEIEELMGRILELDKRHEEEQARFKSDQTQRKKDHVAEVKQLKSQIESFIADKEKLGESQKAHKGDISSLKGVIAGLETELKKAGSSISAQKEKTARFIARINELEVARSAQEKLATEREKEIAIVTQKQKAAASSTKSSDHLLNMPFACIVIGKDSQISEWNPQAEHIFGYSKSEAIGQDIVRLIVPRKDRPKVKALYDRLKKKGSVEPEVRQSYSKNRDVLTCEWHYRVSKADGNVVAYAYEVTQKNDDETSTENQGVDPFRSRFSNNESIVLIVDADSLEVLELNRAAEKLYGYTRRAFLRKRLTEIDLSTEKEMAKLFEDQGNLASNYFVAKHKLKSDEIRDVEFYTSIFNDKARRCILLVGHDVTERLELEQRLKRSEELSRLALLSSDVGVWDWDLQTDTVTFSKRWKEMLGHVEDEIGYNADELYDRVHDDDLLQFKGAIKEHFKGGKNLDIDVRLRCKDGGYRWVRSLGKSINDNEGNIIRYIGTNIDISVVKKLNEKIEEIELAAGLANRAKSQFIANMTREIRTPISAVVGFCELLRETILNSVQEDYVKHINSSSDMLVRILDSMLDLVRIEVGALEIKYDYVNPREFIGEIVESFADAAEIKGIDLDYDADALLPDNIETDPARLRQIVVNLISNAVKFTDKGSVAVNVSAKEGASEGQMLFYIDVKDTGVGIPNKLHGEIFDAFSGINTSDGDRQEHLGFSLALSKSLAQLLGGDIAVESTVNKGSKFSLSVSVGISDSPSFVSGGAGANPLRKPRVQRPLRILYVEDIELNQHVAEAIIDKMDHDLDMVSSAAEALEILNKKDFDVVLMDIHMPEMDGLECSRRIRSEFPPEKQPYIIAVTAAVVTNNRKSCLEAGMDDYLTKPLKRDILKDALKQAYQKMVLDVRERSGVGG